MDRCKASSLDLGSCRTNVFVLVSFAKVDCFGSKTADIFSKRGADGLSGATSLFCRFGGFSVPSGFFGTEGIVIFGSDGCVCFFVFLDGTDVSVVTGLCFGTG